MQENLQELLQQSHSLNASALKIFQALHGIWTFKRVVENHLTPTCSGIVHGTAEFAPLDNLQYLFSEHGVFRTKQHTLQIRNEYRYSFDTNLQAIIVYAAQDQIRTNKLFEFITSISHHQCGSDSYIAEFIYQKPCCFQLTYTVVGPSKLYTSKTTFLQLHS